jgi:hypothetical protein
MMRWVAGSYWLGVLVRLLKRSISANRCASFSAFFTSLRDVKDAR